MNTKEIFILF